MEIKQYFNLFKRWLWLLIIGGILGGLGAGVASIYQPSIYSSSAIMFVSQPNRTELSDLGYLSGQQLIETYAALIVTDKVLNATSNIVGYSVSSNSISVQQIRNTQLLRIVVENEDPAKAAEYANSLIQVFAYQQTETQVSRFADAKASLEATIEEQENLINESTLSLEQLGTEEKYDSERDRLEFALTQARTTYSAHLQNYEAIKLAEAQSLPLIELSEEAKPGSKPIRPIVLNNILLGIVVGVMLAGGTAFLIEYLDDTIRSPEAVVEEFGIPPVGFIGNIPTRKNEDIDSFIYVNNYVRSPIAEAFRSLRTNIEFANASHSLRTILVTSINPSEGKTLIASNLASVIAQEGKEVALVDCDMRRPRVHKQFRLNHRVGLSEYFRGHANLSDVMRKVHENLYLVTTGKLPPNPADLLSSSKITDFFEGAKNLVETIIIDSPPSIVTDPYILSSRVDGVILVIVLGKTKFTALRTALEQFDRAGARIVGIVFNRFENRESQYYQTYTSYEYYQSAEDLDQTQPSKVRKIPTAQQRQTAKRRIVQRPRAED